ncbi:MAG: aspartate aminotransferase family protein [Pseudonocardia sp.]|nr:aspartate aminotransferase family protein [Pseudonocardia sp.]
MVSELLKRTRAVLPSWLAIYYDEPIELERGDGRHVWDADGNCYLDFFGGILTTMTAHALPEVTAAVALQAGKIIHSSTLYLNRPMVELAEQIATVSELGGPDDPAKVFLTPSGTEANDAALLLASSIRRSNQILALRNSYHGRSFSTIAITGNRSWSPTSLSPFQTYYVHGGQQYRSPFAGLPDGEYIAACVADLRDVLDQAGGDVAAFIAEPIQGVGGFTSGPDGLLGAFAEVLRERGILWISDEVQTGWGRTGEHFWGWQASGAVPDLVTFAKGIGNGLSMGGVIAPASMMDSLGANHISTFGGSPLTSAGALANLRYLLDHKLQANAADQGPRLLDGLRALGSPIVGDVRGKGLMIGVELVRDRVTKERATTERDRVVDEAFARGLLILGAGRNAIRFSPPLVLSKAQADTAVRLFDECLTAVASVH